VLAQAGLPRVGAPPRPSKIDVYLPFIRQTLESFPTLTASRLFVMAYERGYRGSADHFRHLIACHRPRLKAELTKIPDGIWQEAYRRESIVQPLVAGQRLR
jgi:hypothetical protein